MNQYLLPIIFVIAFLAVATLVQGLAGGVLANRERSKRVNRRLTLLDSGMGHREVYEALVRQRKAPQIENTVVLKYYGRMTLQLSQAGLYLSPIGVIGIWLGVSAFLWLIVAFVMRNFGTGMGLGEAFVSLFSALVLTAMAESMWISNRRKKRLRVLEEQLPLALDIVIRSLRAGHPVVSALQLVTSEMPDPIGSEFGLIVDETTYGYELRESLANFARRTGSEDAHFFAVSVAIQAETGGNLAEILDNLSKVIRARLTLAQRVKALSSEGRMSAMILSGLPVLLIGGIGLSNPSFYTDKFADPIFWPTVFGILVLYCSGLMMMHRIANFKY